MLRIWTTLLRATASRPVRARSDACCAAKYLLTAAMRVNILKRIISPPTKPQFALSVINLSGQSTAWPPICLRITEDLGQHYPWYNSRCSVSFTFFIIVDKWLIKYWFLSREISISLHRHDCTEYTCFLDLLWSRLFQKLLLFIYLLFLY